MVHDKEIIAISHYFNIHVLYVLYNCRYITLCTDGSKGIKEGGLGKLCIFCNVSFLSQVVLYVMLGRINLGFSGWQSNFGYCDSFLK